MLLLLLWCGQYFYLKYSSTYINCWNSENQSIGVKVRPPPNKRYALNEFTHCYCVTKNHCKVMTVQANKLLSSL